MMNDRNGNNSSSDTNMQRENEGIVKEAYPESALTARIIGCAMEVHSILGSGFQEVIYQKALALEMETRNLRFSREHEMSISYKGHEIGRRRVDFFVEDKIMLELKAVSQLDDLHLAQAINYLEAYGMELGLLLNFGSRRLQFKRVMKPKRKPSQP